MTVPLILSCRGRTALRPEKGGHGQQAWAVTATCWRFWLLWLLCPPSGDGEAQPAQETPSCRSEELSSGSKSICPAGPQRSEGALFCLWSCASSWCAHTCAPCPAPQKVSSILHQIYSNTTLKLATVTKNPFLPPDPVPSSLRHYQSLALSPTSSTAAETVARGTKLW